MSLIDRLKRAGLALTGKSWWSSEQLDAWLASIGRGSTKLSKGKLQTPEQTYRLLADVYKAVNTRAEALASLPLRFVLLKRGQEMPYSEDELPATLLSEDWGEPYKGGTAYQFKHELSCWLDIRGRVRIWLIRAKPGQPPQWLRVLPEWAIMREEPDGSLVVRRDVESIIRIDKADVLTISSFSPDGNPCSLVDVLRVTAGDIDYLRAKEELNQLERGFHQGLIGSIRTGGMQSNEQLAALREQFQQTYAGVDSGASVLLTGDVDWKPLEMGSLADTQHIDSRRYAAEVMYRVPGIPPVLADISRATYDSAEVQERVFWQHTIVPRCRWLASVFNVSLWPLWDADLVARFDFSQVEALQASMEGKYRTANEMKRLGLPIAVINNKLKLDLPRMDGDDQGDYQSVALEPRISLWPERPATRTASLDLTAGAPSLVLGKGNKLPYRRLNAATIRAYYATWDRLLGKASDGSGFEGSYAKTMGKLLRQQERAIDWEACLAAVRTSGECQPYNRPEWVQKFTDGRLRLQFASFREGAKLGSDEVSAATGKAYKAAPAEINAEVQDALKKRCARWALLQDDTTWRSIQATLSTAITEGWDLNAATVKLSELFSALRAETIARTETASALNAGLDWEYRNSDELWGKEWISTIDERSRDTHAEANGQVVPKDGEFEIGGEKLPYPGYSDASAGNIINCRCTEAPIPLNSESEVGE